MIKDIFYKINKYGIDKLEIKKITDIDVKDKKKVNDFFEKCHEGYDLAQKSILENLLELEKKQKEYKNLLKKARRERKTDEISKCQIEIYFIKARTQVLRNLADSLAWQLIGYQKYIAKQLYLGQKPVNLLNSNINSVVETVEEYNKDKSTFSLISDLTSFVQLGDILRINTVKGGTGLSFIEVKEGKVNLKIFKMIESVNKTKGRELEDYLDEDFDEKFIEQFGRVIKQWQKGLNLEDIMKKGEGYDFHTERDIRIPSNTLQLDFYDDYIVEGLKQVEEKGYFFGLVDCLFIGIYSNKCNFPDPEFVFRLACSGGGIPDFTTKYLNNKDKSLSYPVCNIIGGMYSPMAYPLFIRNFPFDFILDIVMGGTLFLLYFDYDLFFKILDKLGIKARWSSHKEYERLKPKDKKNVISDNNRALIIEKGEIKGCLGEGLLVRILFDGMTPLSSLAFFLTKPEFK